MSRRIPTQRAPPGRDFSLVEGHHRIARNVRCINFRHATGAKRRPGGYSTNSHLEIDNNAAEQALRAVDLGRKNFLFAGSNAGGAPGYPDFLEASPHHAMRAWCGEVFEPMRFDLSAVHESLGA